MLQRRMGYAAAALILAAWFEFVVTVEWSYPYCVQPTEGPAYPVIGFPFPYAVANHVSSLEFHFMPHLLMFNLLLIGAALYPLVKLQNRIIAARPALRRLGYVTLICAAVGILIIRGLSLTVGHPVLSIGEGSYLVYSDLRPVGFTSSDVVHSKRKCKPSRFWFPNG